MRIVSLLPSATEIVCALGARDALVGISHECDYPPGLEGVPVLTRARIGHPGSSGEIDRTVRRVLEDALAVYEIDVDALRETRPDVIVTQDLCDVCAVSLDEVHAAVARLAGQDVRIVSLRPMRLRDIWGDVLRVAEAIGAVEVGHRAVATWQSRVAETARRAGAIAARPAALTIEWVDPVMIGGMWMPELVTLAGGVPLLTRPGEHAPTLERARLAALDPDVVLVKPCGFPLERTLAEADVLRRTLPWDTWRAVAEGRVYAADGNAFFNRPGPRVVESLEILAACLHPDGFDDLARKHAASFRRLAA